MVLDLAQSPTWSQIFNPFPFLNTHIWEAFMRKKTEIFTNKGGDGYPRPIYFRFFTEENFYCFEIIYMLKNM